MQPFCFLTILIFNGTKASIYGSDRSKLEPIEIGTKNRCFRTTFGFPSSVFEPRLYSNSMNTYFQNTIGQRANMGLTQK